MFKQCTNVGEGCATAFYFNYLKLIICSKDHHYRIELIKKQIGKDFKSKWIFIIPSVIKNTNQIFSSALSIDENQQKTIGFQLSIWKST